MRLMTDRKQAEASKTQSKSCKNLFDFIGSIIKLLLLRDRRDLICKLAGLFLVVGLHDGVRHRSRGFTAPTAVFNECGDNDLRVPIRREPDEPGIVLVLLALQFRLLTDDLGGAGFSRNIESVDFGSKSRACLVDHSPHRFGHEIDRGFMDGILLRSKIIRGKSKLLDRFRIHQVRLSNRPPEASPPMAHAACIGVTVTYPWPMATDIVSP